MIGKERNFNLRIWRLNLRVEVIEVWIRIESEFFRVVVWKYEVEVGVLGDKLSARNKYFEWESK